MSKKYQEAIRHLSEVSMQFAEALEQFSKAKELEKEDQEDDIVQELRSLSGYQFYMASQQQVLSQLFLTQCTSPLEQQIAAYRNTIIVLFTRHLYLTSGPTSHIFKTSIREAICLETARKSSYSPTSSKNKKSGNLQGRSRRINRPT